MRTRYTTTILGFGNHAAIEIPEKNVKELGVGKRPPVIVRLPGYTFRATGAGMGGKTLLAFSTAHRQASGFWAGDTVEVELELEEGPRPVEIPLELKSALIDAKLLDTFEALNYSSRKEYARQITDAKAEATKQRRIEKVLSQLR